MILVGAAQYPFNVATGGSVTDYTVSGVKYRGHLYTGNGSFTVLRSVMPFDVVGGGGGGGSGQTAQGTVGGRGGLGVGVVTSLSMTPGTYTVTIGTGGPGAGIDGWGQGNGGSGGSTTISSVSFTAAGGGGGKGPGDQNHPQPASIGSPDGPQANSVYGTGIARDYSGPYGSPNYGGGNLAGLAGGSGSLAIRYRIG